MTVNTHPIRLTLTLLAAGALLAACGDSGSTDATRDAAPPAKEPTKPLLQKKEIADWCPEHGVPESICTRCNATLIKGFKEKGDWCAGHDLPESQCFDCNPELEAKFKANAPGAARDK